MINKQSSESLQETYRENQCQVYDDLSSFMQFFKKMLIAIEELAFNHRKQFNCELPQQKLKIIAKALEVLMHKYAKMSGLFRIQIKTFQRFMCRLIETIALYQLKYQSNNNAQVTFILNTLAEIQMIIKENQSIYHFVNFIKAMKNIADKFSQMKFDDLEYSIRKDASPKNKVIRRFKMLDKIDMKMAKLKEYQKEEQLIQQGNRCESDQDEAQQQSNKNLAFSQIKGHSLPFSHPISNDLQKRFNLYKGLDLDFVIFKSSYYSAKNNTQQFYREYLQRNLLIAKLIKAYLDNFSLFQKKKKIRHHRKLGVNKNSTIKSLQKQQSYRNNYSQVIETQRLIKKNEFIKKTVIHKQIYDQNKHSVEQSTKSSFKISNVYLTFGKKPINNLKNIRNQPNITPNILKGKQEASNYYFNQSFCPKKNLTITQSIDLGKIICQMKDSQRVKTSPNKNISFQSSKYPYKQIQQLKKSLKEGNQVFLGNKKRYLQLDCTSKKEISLNKIILTGSINIKHLRLNKLNEEKGKNILF